MQLWTEMELENGVQANAVTFNILFDVAVKGGHFALADMVLEEMKARNLPIERYTRVGLIYYHGRKADGDGIRRAYRELVQAGEIVDTVVLNCVIASLLRAGEPHAGEQVFERMKLLHAQQLKHSRPKEAEESSQPAPPARSQERRTSRDLGRALQRLARARRGQPAPSAAATDDDGEGSAPARQLVHAAPPTHHVGPNIRTYLILLEHHVSQTGELYRIARLLEEMRAANIPLQGRIFVELFRGFARHGGLHFTPWTRGRLEGVWHAFLAALDAKAEGVEMGRGMVRWILKAFKQCAGKEEARSVWSTVWSRWEGSESDTAAVLDCAQEELQ